MPLAMLAMLVADYVRIHSTDALMRRIFVFIASTTFFAILMDLGYDYFAEQRGAVGFYGSHITCFLYYLLMVGSFNSLNVFIDYAINHNPERTRMFAKVVGWVSITQFLILLLNLRFQFYYHITDTNTFERGPLYIVHIIYAALPAPISFVNAYFSRKNLHRSEAPLILMPLIWINVGTVLDALLSITKMVWPCFCVSLLFFYFFIIRRDSFSDALTGVDNRRSCDEYMRNIVNARKYQSYGFIMIDLDKFKQINDVYGHVQGDQALRDAAQLLRSCLRRSDFVARYGGDEFLIISPMNTKLDLLVERINAALTEYNARKHRPFELQMSMGYDTYHPGSEHTPQEFLAHVDALMYQRKNRRRTQE